MIEHLHYDLLDLERAVTHALESGDESKLKVLGYGEVTLVLLLSNAHGEFAVKRLPIFPEAKRFEGYKQSLDIYLERMQAAGVRVAPSELWHSTRPDGSIVAYVVQKALARDRVGHNYLKQANATETIDFVNRVADIISKAISPTLGIDAQASNWVLDGDDFVYLDVTTPLMRDGSGNEMLDVKLFMTSLPWLMREPVRIGLSNSIFDKSYSPRAAIVDLLANLYKERLADRISSLCDALRTRFQPAITEAEVKAYYDEDAKLWSLIQRLRQADRWWQRNVRRRTYPFLLPRAIER